MGWDFLTPLAEGAGALFGGPLGSGLGAALGSGIGALLGNGAQSNAANQATAAQQAANAAQLQAQQDAFNRGTTFQGNQFSNNVGLQGNQFATNLDLQNGFLNRAAGQGANQAAALNGIFSPYTTAGAGALGGLNQYGAGGLRAFDAQGALAGANGADAQQAAIMGLSNSPLFQALAKSQDDAILQNASATGGLHGGNVNVALANSRAGLLNNFVQQQFGNLGTLSNLGAGSLSNLGQFGSTAAGNQAAGLGSINNGFLNLLGNVAGNVAGSSNQLMTGIGNASNQYANNMANLAANFGDNFTNLLGQGGAITAGNALRQGTLNSQDANVLGILGGQGLQRFAQYGNAQAPVDAAASRAAAYAPGVLNRWLGGGY